MANFSNFVLTNAGLALLARAQTGTPIVFTAAKVGSGDVGSTDPKTLTDLVSVEMSCIIQGISVNGPKARVNVYFNNSAVSTGFDLLELGLYAQDPDNHAANILYAYASDPTPDSIPTSGTPEEYLLPIILIISNASSVTATIDSSFGFPSGGIILWSGASTAIPTGWALCNGSSGTPDLRNRFVVGAGSTYAVGATGGEAAHTLAISELPNQKLTVSRTFNTGGSATALSATSGGTPVESNAFFETAGGATAHENRPPYYALCYIMKL